MASTLLSGTCRALYCFDVSRSIDLSLAERTLTSARRTIFQHKSRVPQGSMTPPLRLAWKTAPVLVGSASLEEELEIALYDAGALCITWSLPFSGPLDELVRISALLYDNARLTERSREIAGEILGALGGAAVRPEIASHIEDYAIFQVAAPPGGHAALLRDARPFLARVLRAEERELSTQEVDDALGSAVSYAHDDLCLVDWLAAFLVGPDTEDERLVLELATIELLELRRLDARLDDEIEGAYELLARPRRPWSRLMGQRREIEEVARMQADDALVHEGIDNALKLFGDDYLARLYRTSAARFHFNEWDLSIQRKIGVLRSVYESLADLAANRRAEVLEWIIIVLIAVDIAVYLLPLR